MRHPRQSVMTLLATALLLLSLLLAGGYLMSRMPGPAMDRPLPQLDGDGEQIRLRLQEHVAMLAGQIGERHIGRPSALQAAADYIASQFRQAGLAPRGHSYTVANRDVQNIEAILPGRDKHAAAIVVGAHYDTVPGTPGANDNASGIATLLEIARGLAGEPLPIPVRLVAFVNEEPPFFKTATMGSRVYAARLKTEQADIAGMISLETVGFFSDAPNSQKFPLPLLRLYYPDRGDFIAFVGNFRSRSFLQRCLRHFRQARVLPAEGLAAPGAVPGVDWSDHWSFWQEGWPAIMITDTAPYRYPYYHSARDTPDRIDYNAMTRLVQGLMAMIRSLADHEGSSA